MTTPSEALADEIERKIAGKVSPDHFYALPLGGPQWTMILAALRSASVPSVDEIARLREGLLDATAHLAGAASAYKHFAKRHRSLGHVPADALFTTRIRDFEAAVERARALLALLTPAETQVDSIMRRATEAQAERTRTWPSPATSAAAETAPHPGDHVGDGNKMVAGEDGIVERLRSIGISPLASEAAAEIESANEEIKRLNDDVACARSEAFDDALAALAEQEAYFASEQYATGQPMSSFAERFALRRAVHAIFLLKENDR